MSTHYDSTQVSTDNFSANIIAEEKAQYVTKNRFLTPYTDRTDLTVVEKICIGNYQDYHPWNEQKKDWSFEIPEGWKEKPWCFAMNTCCRSLEF